MKFKYSIKYLLDKKHHHELLSFLSLFKLNEIKHKSKIRVGSEEDGGYIIIDKLGDYDSLYSYGVGNNITFDISFTEIFDCPGYLYDHTIDTVPKLTDNLIYHKEGVSGRYNPSNNVNTIKNHVDKNGDDNNKNLFLKMDIEGHEWEVLKNLELETLKQFKQITMELHSCYSDKHLPIWEKKNIFELIFRNYYLVNININNVGKWFTLSDTTYFEVIEITLVRKDTIEEKNLSQVETTKIVRNNSKVPSIPEGSKWPNIIFQN